MTRIIALAASLAAVAALAIGVPAAGAQDRPSVVDAVAARLGVSPEKLREAFRAAMAERIDAAVASGRLTAEQGARLKERIANAKGLGFGVRHGFAKKQKAFAQRIAKTKGRGPAATYLGMTREELRSALRQGHSLAAIARSKGTSVDGLVAAMLAPAKERLAKAVAENRLTKARADEILARLTARATKLVERVPSQHRR